MRRLRGTGLAIIILAGMSGCAGVQRHLSWPSHESSQAEDSESPRFGWWKRPAPDRSFSGEPGAAPAEMAQNGTVTNGTVMTGNEAGRDIWSAESSDGVARYFPNTVRTWNRFTSRFRAEGTGHIDDVPVEASKNVEFERTALHTAARDRQVKTVRMTEGRDQSDRADSSPKSATNSLKAKTAPEDEDGRVQSADAAPAPVFYEPTSAGRPRPITYADLARDPAANGAVTEDDNIRPATVSRVDSEAAPVTLLVAMNDAPTATRTVGLTDTAIPDASSAENVPGQNAPTLASDSTRVSQPPNDPPARSVATTSADGPATATMRSRLREIRTTATEPPAEPAPATTVGMPTPTSSRAQEPVARLASNADVPASAGIATAVAAVTSTPAVPMASTPVASTPVMPVADTPVAVSPQSPAPSPQSTLAHAHNHSLFGWLCPFKKSPHPVLPSTQLPTPAYPTSYEWSKPTKVAKCEAPVPSPQAAGCTEAHIPKKPCFLKTWLHTSAQASLEEPAVLPQPQYPIVPPAPKKPCFLKTMFHNHDAPAVTATPQASPQGSVVATSAVKKPCFLKAWMHKFDHQPTAGCTCAGCAQGGSHCCCESQRRCGFKHFGVHPTGQQGGPSRPAPAPQTALNEKAVEKDDVVRTSSRGAEADDVAEKRKLQSSTALTASPDNFDKSPQG